MSFNEKLMVILFEDSLCLMGHVFLSAFKITSLCLWWIMRCLDVDLCEFYLFGVHWASWVWRLMSFMSNLRSFLPLFLNIFSLLLTLLNLVRCMLVDLVVPQFFWSVFYFSSFVLLSVLQTGWSQLICLQVWWFFFPASSNGYFARLMKFSFHLP